MKDCAYLASAVEAGRFDACLSALYGAEGVKSARQRALGVIEGFVRSYGNSSGAVLVSGPGRTELGGNHTDHQHGHVLCASVDLDLLACAAPNGSAVIRVCSEGYPPFTVDLDILEPRPEERNTSAGLVRGMAAGLRKLGLPVGGMDLYAVSQVPAGSGLSSSAAYEILLGAAMRSLFPAAGTEPDAVALAKLGQHAENVYFGKPCGLMDQMGAAVGGAVAIDFADPADPAVEKLEYDFSRSGHALCIVDSGSSHDDLTEDYAAVTREMCAVAAYFGKTVLRQVPEADFRAALGTLRQDCGDRAVLRARHFYAEDRRAVREAEALRLGDFDRFLALVNDSGLSSVCDLQNIWSPAHPEQQAVSLALSLARELLEGTGAARVHGGGFAGTIQAFVPEARLDKFKAGMEAVLGAGRCHVLNIRPVGGCVLWED